MILGLCLIDPSFGQLALSNPLTNPKEYRDDIVNALKFDFQLDKKRLQGIYDQY